MTTINCRMLQAKITYVFFALFLIIITCFSCLPYMLPKTANDGDTYEIVGEVTRVITTNQAITVYLSSTWRDTELLLESPSKEKHEQLVEQIQRMIVIGDPYKFKYTYQNGRWELTAIQELRIKP